MQGIFYWLSKGIPSARHCEEARRADAAIHSTPLWESALWIAASLRSSQ